MVNIGDTVRVMDATEVIEGEVTAEFVSNGVQYYALGTKVYTDAEVTKVPSVAQTADLPKELRPATEEYIAELDDRPDSIKTAIAEGLTAEDIETEDDLAAKIEFMRAFAFQVLTTLDEINIGGNE